MRKPMLFHAVNALKVFAIGSLFFFISCSKKDRAEISNETINPYELIFVLGTLFDDFRTSVKAEIQVSYFGSVTVYRYFTKDSLGNDYLLAFSTEDGLGIYKIDILFENRDYSKIIDRSVYFDNLLAELTISSRVYCEENECTDYQGPREIFYSHQMKNKLTSKTNFYFDSTRFIVLETNHNLYEEINNGKSYCLLSLMKKI